MTTTATLTIACADDGPYALRLTIRVTPPDGERWNSAGMALAERAVRAAAYRVAAQIVAEAGADTLTIPAVDVRHGETWAGASTAFVIVEHDGEETVSGYVWDLVQRPWETRSARALLQ